MSIITLAELKDFCRIDPDRTADDAILELARVAGESDVWRITGAAFGKDTTATARVFVPSSGVEVWVNYFHTTTDLVVKTDDDGDGVYETTWASADYQLHPLNGRLRDRAWSYNRIEAVDSSCWPMRAGRASVQVTAQWGWATVPDEVRKAALIFAASRERVRDLVRGEGGFTRFARQDAEEMLEPFVNYDAIRVA